MRVFTETGIAGGVSRRYQPNVRMTLGNIKVGGLPAATEAVTRHAQPRLLLRLVP